MISSGQKSNLSLPWECGMIRFTAFSNSLIEDGEELFEDFFSIPADTVTRRKAEFYSEFQSSIGVAACQTIIQGKKIDFILSAAADGDTSPSGFPALPAGGDFEARVKAAAQRFLERDIPVNRIAVAQRFLKRTSSTRESYDILSKILKITFSERDCDFQLRINRPRQLSLNDKAFTLNRLGIWNAIRFQNTQVDFNIAMPEAGMVTQGPPEEAVSVHTDVNTAVPSMPFVLGASKEEKKQLVDLMLQSSKEIVESTHEP